MRKFEHTKGQVVSGSWIYSLKHQVLGSPRRDHNKYSFHIDVIGDIEGLHGVQCSVRAILGVKVKFVSWQIITHVFEIL